MAAYTTKIFVLLALLALSASATMAATSYYCPPMTAMGAMEPCRQYLMQEFGMGGSPAMIMQQPPAMLRQQCCMQLQGMMPQCQCNAMCQMMQSIQQDPSTYYGGEQQMMMMRLAGTAMRLPYICGTTPAYCQLFPGGGC